MIWLKRALSLAALALFLYLFWPLLGEVRQAAGLFRQVRWSWLAVALVIQLMSYACLTALNYLLLRPFAGHTGFWRLMATLTAMAFVEVALPSAGASGVILRARLLSRDGYSIEAATFTLFLEAIYVGLAMGIASLSGLGYLLHSEALSRGQLALLGGMILFALVVVGLVFWLKGDRPRARRGLAWLVGGLNRLADRLHRRRYSLEKALARLDQFYHDLARLDQTSPWPYLLAAAGRVILDVGSLGACFVAFGYLISPGTLLTGYGLTMLLSSLAALPGGLGLADVSMAVIYARLGVSGAAAIAVTLAYRLIAFWLLRLVGFINWQLLARDASR